MQKEIKQLINLFKDDELLVNSILVSIFLRQNDLEVKHNLLLKSLTIPTGSDQNAHLHMASSGFTFDDLIEAFELAIPSQEKVSNGAVYTPAYIKTYIVEETTAQHKKPLDKLLIADISCGCGGFLATAALHLKKHTNKSFLEIYKDNLFGLDINASSILRSKILLSLLAILHQEDNDVFEFNLSTANALSYDWKQSDQRIASNNGFDLIIGNPPYVRAKNIDQESKSLLSQWKVTASGNPDLYIPFFEIGLEQLNDSGMLGYITVNSFYKSVNARSLRKYFQSHEYALRIIDFGNEKIFTGISAYTCICLISKEKSETVTYSKANGESIRTGSNLTMNFIRYKDLDAVKGWLLNDIDIVKNIRLIESAGPSLGERYRIKNGIATLSNDIYIFRPVGERNDCYQLKYEGKVYEIEKAICQDIIKPNILKVESEIDQVKEKLIFPYFDRSNPVVMPEAYLRSNFPKAYVYLLANKSRLDMRDKGEGDYVEWYAFGRTQALTDKGYKLMFPYIAKSPHFVYTEDEDMMIYCGYALFNESKEELKILKRILESEVFQYYVINTSKPYSAGYYSYAKNYVKNFGIPFFTEAERHFLSNGVTKKQVNDFLRKKYLLDI